MTRPRNRTRDRLLENNGHSISPLDRGVLRRRNAVHVIFAISGVGLAGVVARIPTLRDDLGLTTAELGILLLGLSAGSVLGLMMSGRIVSAFGSRTTIISALLLSAISLSAMGVGSSIAHDPRVVCAALVAFGFGSGVCNVAMNVVGASVERLLQRPIMPHFHAAFSVGGVAGSGIAALGAAFHLPVIIDLTGISLVLIGGALATARFLETRTADTADHRRTPRHVIPRRAWLEKRTLLIGLLVMSTGFAAGSANDWLSLAMVDGHGASNSLGAITYGAFAVTGMAGRLAGVSLLSRYGRVAALRYSAALTCIGVGFVIFIPNTAVAFVGAMLWGLGTALGFPVGMSAAADNEAMASARISVVATIGYTASLLGPPLIGFLGAVIGILNALAIVIVFAILAGILAVSAREEREETVPDHA